MNETRQQSKGRSNKERKKGGVGGAALTNGSSDVKKIRVLVEEGRGGELVFFCF